jgi:LuxR family transcriptional regulator, maltose regulon positive regulatory protein
MPLNESLRRSVTTEVAGKVEAGEQSMPVAAAKIQIPASTSTTLVRERLHALLNAGVAISDTGSPLTVVCAPAGAGKTTMVANWVRRWIECGDGYAAWVSLDAEDNDPVLLWSAIIRALRSSGAWDRGGAADLLAPPHDEAYATFLAAVTAAFDQPRAPVVLVLDGIDEVRAAEAVRTLNLLLRQAPAMLRIVLVARFPPPLNLARLKVEGRLREIDPSELNFSAEEAAQLFAGAGITLTDPELRQLMERTEGWPAGLRLAAMTFDDAAPTRHLTRFTGADRVVADYLVEEVLHRQPAEVQQFMLSTSVSQTFTAGLAAALCRQQRVGHILEYLERAGILVCDRDRSQRWYHYHPLLGRCLRAELGRRRLSAQYELHRIAAGWFTAAGKPLRAMAHAIATKDDELVAQLVENHGLGQILAGRASGLRRMLGSAPPDVLARPSVALIAAETALSVGDLPTADRWLQRTTTGRQPLRGQWQRVLHATVWLHRHLLHGDIGAALAALRTTRAGQTGDRDLDLLALLRRGVAAAWTGDRQAATTDLHRALDRATADHRAAVALECRAQLAAQGDFTQLSEQAESALEFAKSHGLTTPFRCAYLHTLLGVVAYQQLDDDRAKRLCVRATTSAGMPIDPATHLFADTLRAMITFEDADDPHSVAAVLRGRWQQSHDRNLSPVLLAYLAPGCQRMALRIGDHALAMEMVERADTLLYPCAERVLLRATVHAHTGKTGPARRLLATVLNGQHRMIVTPTLVDAWLLEARLAQRAADLQRAHEAVVRALTLAAPHGIIRPFLDCRELLSGGVGRFGQLEPFATEVLAAIPAPVADLTEGLTKRELALLNELPSMHTVEEIAGTLFVSVNTVKTHLRGIYRKLGVNRRRDAITVARQRGLL